MNSYELSRAWFDFCFENAEKIKPNHTALYFFAIEQCNRLGWKKVFGLPTTMTMEAIGIRSYNTYKNTLDDLVKWKFVTMVEVSKNQFSSNKIALSNFNKALNNALDKALIVHGAKQSESTGQSIDSVDKQETINKETINKEPVYSKEVHDCFNFCLPKFPEKTRPTTVKQKDDWLKCIENLNKIDGYPFDHIQIIVKKTRADSFWGKQFLSILKLRKKDPNKVMYVEVFKQAIKADSSKQKNSDGIPSAPQMAWYGHKDRSPSELSAAHKKWKLAGWTAKKNGIGEVVSWNEVKRDNKEDQIGGGSAAVIGKT